ncbi:hypothetical protein [Nevskia sp.]|uniref:hypothetical protein n=1 Tax=Nevskia sp. TaxID=1929292 RepID=UPI0025D97BCB|nr:hypothetical protein [Nevskia sp.]
MQSDNEARQTGSLERLVGQRLVLRYGAGNPGNRTMHIRAVVDGEWLAMRHWSHRKGWVYTIEHSAFVELALEHGNGTLRPNAIVQPGLCPTEKPNE